MIGVLKSKKFLMGVGLVILAGIGVGLWLWLSKPAKVTKTTQADITKGTCDTAAYNNLLAVRDSTKGGKDKAAEGQALENIGLCFIYQHKDQDALTWFQQAKAVYEKAGLKDAASRAQNSIESIQAEKNRAPAKSTNTQLDGTQ
jgi:hypothetical protein